MERVWEYLRNKQNQSPISPDEEAGQKGSLVRTTPRYSQTLCISIIARCLLYEAMMSIVTLNVSSLQRKSMKSQECTCSTQTMGIRATEVGSSILRWTLKSSGNMKIQAIQSIILLIIFVKYLLYLPQDVDYFYCRPLPDDGSGSGIPCYGKQPVGRNKLSQIIPQMCKEARIEGRKTGHFGKVTCATALYRQDFSDQLIKERTGHRSLEALHKYKRTGPDQQYKVSMALLPQIHGKENKKLCMDDDDDEEKAQN